MKKGIEPLSVYLGEIQYSIIDISSYIENKTKEDFCNTTLLARAVAQALAQIGEAAHCIAKHYPDFAKQYPAIKWDRLYNYRNKISHHYRDVNPIRTWELLKIDFPLLKESFNDVLVSEPQTKSFVDAVVKNYYMKHSTQAILDLPEQLSKVELVDINPQSSSPTQIFLDVPRMEEETKELNKLGAKWDNDTKSLYIMSDNPNKDAVLNQVEAMKQAKLQKELVEASTAKNKQEQGVTLESKQTSSAQTDRQRIAKFEKP